MNILAMVIVISIKMIIVMMVVMVMIHFAVYHPIFGERYFGEFARMMFKKSSDAFYFISFA